MELSLLNLTRISVALLVAWLESVSVIIFIWSSFQYSLTCWMSVGAVFYLNVYGAYRNTDKICRLWESSSLSGNFELNIVLSLLVALVAFLTKRFVLMVYFPPIWIFQILSMNLTLIYANYVLFNTLADMKQMSMFFTFPRDDVVGCWKALLKKDSEEILLYGVLAYAAMITYHYKVLAVSISIASLVDRYGGVYQWLGYCKRLVHFPIVSIGLYNVNRCAKKIKQLWMHKGYIGYSEVIYLTGAVLAAYTQGVSNKVLALGSDKFLGLMALSTDKFANYARRLPDMDIPQKKAQV